MPSSTLAPSTSTASSVSIHPPQIYSNTGAVAAVENERRNNAAAAAATTAVLNSWMVPPDLVAESSSGFAMVIDQSGTIEFVSETVRCHVGHAGQSMRGQSIYNYVLPADQDKVMTALHPQNLISPANVGPGSSISADPDANYRRTFPVRFLVNHANNSGNTSSYETVFLSTVPLRKPNKSPSLLCVARKMNGLQLTPLQQNPSAVQELQVDGANGPADLFSTRLDPTSFRILHSETDKSAFSSRASSMVGKCFLEFCHHEDQDIVRTHFLETLQGNSGSVSMSKPYRMVGIFSGGPQEQQQRAIRVQTRSRYFKPAGHHEKGFILSAHSMLRPSFESQIQATTAPPAATLTYLLSTSNARTTPTTTTMPSAQADPFPATLPPPTESQQKNLLLKSLLNATFSNSGNEPGSSDSTGQMATVSNSRILQLLSQVSCAYFISLPPVADVKSLYLFFCVKKSASGVSNYPFASFWKSIFCRRQMSLVVHKTRVSFQLKIIFFLNFA